jgi:predicted aspartyl protease
LENAKQKSIEKTDDNMTETNFWDRLKTFNFQITKEQNLDKDYSAFVDGMKFWTGMELDKAEEIFKYLYLSSAHSDIKRYAALILFNIMSSARDFRSIIDLKLNETKDIIDSDDVELAAAFSKFPDERYIFESSESKLHMDFSISGNPIIEVGINGKKKSFWLDTGAQVSIISAGTAKECGILSNSDLSINATADSTNFNVGSMPSYIKNLELGDLIIKNHPLLVVDDKMLTLQNPKTKITMRIDGIIGWNAIQNIDIYIDYKNKTAHINRPVDKHMSSTNIFAAGRPILSLKTTNGTQIHLGIDTGASQSSISRKIITGVPDQNIVKKLVTIGTLGGTKQVETMYAQKQEFFIAENKKIFFEKMRVEPDFDKWAVFFNIDGVIGSDAVRNSCLHIDYLNGTAEIII